MIFPKLKAVCLHSITIAWAYCLALLAGVMQIAANAADALGDPELKEQIGAAVGDPKTTGRILLIISIVTIVARLRSLRKAS
jgi:hypothetical protein